VSVNQLNAAVLAEKLASLGAQDYLASRTASPSKEKFERALAQVPDTDVDAVEGAV
jgi:hypothetical protein